MTSKWLQKEVDIIIDIDDFFFDHGEYPSRRTVIRRKRVFIKPASYRLSVTHFMKIEEGYYTFPTDNVVKSDVWKFNKRKKSLREVAWH